MVVTKYSSCALTKDSDKLIALAGYAQMIQHALRCSPSDYVAGMWRAYLPEDLLWRADSHSATRYATYHAPSWSWASVKGSVGWNPEGARSITEKDLACRILQIDLSLVDSTKPFGPLSAATIHLCGPLCRVAFGPGIGRRNPRLQYIDVGQVRFSHSSLTENLDDTSMYRFPAETLAGLVTYFCRFATIPEAYQNYRMSDGLLLARSSDLPAGVFHRIGYARFSHKETPASFEEMCCPELDLPSDVYLHKSEDGKFVFRIE